MPTSPLHTAALAIAFCFTAAGTLRSAPVTWQAPFNLTGVSGLSTNGMMVRAVNATNDAVSPAVMVAGESMVFEAQNIGVSSTGTGTYFTGEGGDTGDANLNAVLNSHAYHTTAWNLVLSGLTAGSHYQIQLIGAGDTRGCCSSRNQRAGDNEAIENVSADFSRSGVGSVIGTFIAGGTTQTIRILPGMVNGIDPGLSGYILRTIAPPGPQAPTNITLTNANIAPGTTAGMTIGTLNAIDANAGDTHTFSLTDSAAFPDNPLFAVAGNQLRSAAAAGGPGTSYQVKVRATDSSALTFDKVLTLTVEPPQTPSALSFSATTIQATTPPGGTAGTFSTVDANAADVHTYALVAGTGSTDNARFSVAGNTLQVAAALPSAGGTLSVRVRSTDLSGLFIESVFTLGVIDTTLRINEFLADNTAATLADEDGDTPDWIEIHNPSATAVSLAGWHITDDPLVPAKWTFPNVSIPAGGYRVLFASGKNRAPLTGNLHANFSLDSAADYVALVAPGGASVVSEFGAQGSVFPNQRAGISYGYYGNPVQIGYMRTPTPNAANNAASGVAGFVNDTKFSVNRGFYDTAFDLAITTLTEGATIRFTTNGSWPTESAGTIYTAPIRIDRSMPVKAIAYKPGYVSTNVDTHTYLFINEVVTQTSASVQSVNGFPASWNGNAVYYGMNGNPSAVNPLTHPTIRNDLRTVPSLSIAIDTADMFGTSGIYSNPNSAGAAWERKTSLEFIDPAVPDGSGDFHENCVIQIQGGAFRGFGLTRKKSFRITFKPDFGTGNLPTGGPGKLDYPLFGPDAVQEFNTFTLRMESNDGWQWSGAGGKPQYARDQFARRAMAELGQPNAEGRFLHVYINGVYWGIYNAVERPDASFGEAYFGADPALWQGQNSGSPTNGATNIADWNTMLGVVDDVTPAATDVAKDAEYLEACGFRPDGSRNPAFPIWIDPTNFADYLLVNWYAGNSDWPFKNYYCGRARQPNSTGFKFFMWDCEWSLLLQSSTTTNRTADFSGVAAPQSHLEKSPEYRLRFADRAFRAMFNNGPLTPARARVIYDQITAQHRSILIPESARWGNQHGGQYGLTHWQNEYNSIVNTWFPVRTGNFLSQLRGRSLYPALDAPMFSQPGGSVPPGGTITMTVPSTVAKIFWQFGSGDTDATDYVHSLDPRQVGGGIHPSATLIDLGGGGGAVTTQFVATGAAWKYLDNGTDQGAAWQEAAFDDSAWLSGPSQLGYGDNDEATPVGSIDIDPVTAGVQRNATTYFRRTVNIPTPADFADFTLNCLFDDAIVVYVNGTPVENQNIPVDPAYTQYTTTSVENQTSSKTLPSSAFQPGLNTIAAEVHQRDSASSDISFDLTLTGNPPGGGGTRTTPPIPIPNHGWMFARSFDSNTGAWSALNSAFFTVATVPADASNLVISEFNYHPAEPPAGSVSMDRDDYEYIELMNVLAGSSIDLTGVRFTGGVEFEFSDRTLIAPGGRIVMVRNRAAFEQRYAANLAGVTFAINTSGTSEYTGRLSNDGEAITLVGATGADIRNFSYDDRLPWPPGADGPGHSLVLKHPGVPPPDHALPQNWVAGNALLGAPGQPDVFGFTGNPAADADFDGFSALAEYSLGTSDAVAGDAASRVSATFPEFPPGTESFLTITFRRNLLAHHAVLLAPEVSTALTGWAGGAAVVFVSETDHGDGTSTVLYRSAAPRSLTNRGFIRLRATTQP